MREQHPENDLELDIDRMNLHPPGPRTLEELAEGPDPVAQARRNAASSRQAGVFVLVLVVASAVSGLGSLLVFRGIGGPECALPGGTAVWICSSAQRISWMVLASIFPLAGVIGAGVITLRKLYSYARWGIWMGVFWFSALHFMAWGISVLQALLDW